MGLFWKGSKNIFLKSGKINKIGLLYSYIWLLTELLLTKIDGVFGFCFPYLGNEILKEETL